MKEKIKLLINKQTTKNGIWMYVLQFFNLILPIITIPYITRVMGRSAYGTFSIALNIITYLQVIVEYGFGMSATRKVAINGKKNINKLFTSVLMSRIILLIICCLISFAYVLIKIENTTLCLSFLILTICLLGYCVQVNWVFQGLQEMKYISIVNIVGRLLSTLLIFVLVRSTNDLLLYCFLYSISPFFSGFIGLSVVHKKYGFRCVKVSLNDIVKELKDGFYVFTTQLSSKVFGSIGVTFLGIYSVSSVVGVYSAIQKIPNVIILLWTPIAQVIYPLSSQHFNNSFGDGIAFVSKIKKHVLPLFIAFAVIISYFGKDIVVILFGVEYSEYYYWLWPLLMWLIVAIDNNFLGIQILLGSGHDEEYGKAFWIGVMCTIIINYLLIRQFGGDGASIAPLLAEVILNLLLRHKIHYVCKSLKLE